MGEWQSVDVAPRELPLIVRTERGRVFRAKITWMGEGSEWSWASVEEDDPVPNCWTDGVCWDVNADEERSDWPVGWMHMPAEHVSPQAHSPQDDTLKGIDP